MRSSRATVVMQWVLVFGVFGMAGGVEAQGSVPQTPDLRVRLRFQEPGKPAVIGRLLEIRSDTLVVSPDHASAPTTIVAGDLRSMERWEKRRHTVAGLFVGLLGGAVLGAVAGMSAGDDPCEPNRFVCFALTAEEKAAFYGLGLGAIGALLGASVGAAIRTDGWTRMPLAKRVAIAPARDGRLTLRPMLPVGQIGK